MGPAARWTPGTVVLLGGLALFFAVFLVYPVGFILREAFLADGRFTLRHFALLLGSPTSLQAMLNSFTIAGLTTLLTTLLTLPLAHLLTRYQFRGQTLLNGLLLIPMVMPPFVGAIGLRQILARYGSLNLAAAVQVACYELALASRAFAPSPGGAGEPATGEDLEALHARLRSLLVASGFIDPENPGRYDERLRRLASRANLEREEVRLIHGILEALSRRAGSGG